MFNIHLPIIVFSYPINTNSHEIINNNRKLVCRFTNDIRKNTISDMVSKTN